MSVGGKTTGGRDLRTGRGGRGSRRKSGAEGGRHDEKGWVLEVWSTVGVEGVYDRGPGCVCGEGGGRGRCGDEWEVLGDVGVSPTPLLYDVLKKSTCDG